ncbi:MAG: ATP-grasp domain-containing protein [Actinomycetota bacterium]|nr:ATP-grasp domain-containing protein [Actinomycetota bacterium]
MSFSRGTTVLVTGGEHFGGLAAIRGLVLAGHDAWAAVVRNHSYAAWSRLPAGTIRVPDPVVEPEPFAEAVAAAADHIGARVVLPGTDVALSSLAGRLDAFQPGIAVGVCSPDLVERATSKTALSELAEAAGLDVPPTRVLTRADVEAAQIAFPAVVKPPRSDVEGADGSLVHNGARRVENARALRDAIAQLGGNEWLAQPYVSGELVAVGGVAWEGAVVAEIHQLSRRIWPPDCGGSSYAATIEPDAERSRKVRRLVANLGWSGIFQVQLLRRGTKEFLIDFNPRFYGTLALALAAGVNLPAVWVDLLRGVEISPPPTYRVGVRFRAQWKDVRALATTARAGGLGEATAGLVPRASTCHPVFNWDDPLPAIAGPIRIARAITASMRAALEQAPKRLDKPPGTS